jgi:hypothetical protein
MLTYERLRDLLVYDMKSGEFRWRDDLGTRAGPKMNGRIAGGLSWNGYVKIKVDGVLHSAHRLAWLYVYGDWPEGSLDHADGDRKNNVIANLRIATRAQNSANKKSVKRRIAPYRGVMPHGPGFVARIHNKGQRFYLGYFTTAKAARDAYQAKAKELHGEFAHVEPDQDWRAPASYMGLGFSGMN